MLLENLRAIGIWGRGLDHGQKVVDQSIRGRKWLAAPEDVGLLDRSELGLLDEHGHGLLLRHQAAEALVRHIEARSLGTCV